MPSSHLVAKIKAFTQQFELNDNEIFVILTQSELNCYSPGFSFVHIHFGFGFFIRKCVRGKVFVLLRENI